MLLRVDSHTGQGGMGRVTDNTQAAFPCSQAVHTAAENSRKTVEAAGSMPAGQTNPNVPRPSQAPPSIVRISPVMKPDSGDARNATAFATSSAVPHRPRGTMLVMRFTASGLFQMSRFTSPMNSATGYAFAASNFSISPRRPKRALLSRLLSSATCRDGSPLGPTDQPGNLGRL